MTRSAFDASASPMDSLFQLNTPGQNVLAGMVSEFFSAQLAALRSAELLAQEWFHRRRLSASAAHKAAQNMADARSFPEFAREYQTWMSGAVERTSADLGACQKHFPAMAAPLKAADDETAGQQETRRGSKADNRESTTVRR